MRWNVALVGKVVDRWRDEDLLAPPASEHEIAAVESALADKGTLPPELAALWRWSNGTTNMDSSYYGFWSTTRVLDEAANTDWGVPAGYLAFCDYLIDSHAYAVNLGEASDVARVEGGSPPQPIAPTFSAFLEMYLRDDDGLNG